MAQPRKIPVPVQRLFARLLAASDDRETGILANVRDVRQQALELLEVDPAEPTKTAVHAVVAWCDATIGAYLDFSTRMQALFDPKPAAETPSPQPKAT